MWFGVQQLFVGEGHKVLWPLKQLRGDYNQAGLDKNQNLSLPFCTCVLLAWSYFELAQSSVNSQMSHENFWPMKSACLTGKSTSPSLLETVFVGPCQVQNAVAQHEVPIQSTCKLNQIYFTRFVCSCLPQNWSVQYNKSEPVPPRYEINAPDLYIPGRLVDCWSLADSWTFSCKRHDNDNDTLTTYIIHTHTIQTEVTHSRLPLPLLGCGPFTPNSDQFQVSPASSPETITTQHGECGYS